MCSILLFQPPNRPACRAICLKPEGVTLCQPWEHRDSLAKLKVANRSGLRDKPFGERRAPLGMIMPQGGPGAQPRHAFGSFRRETKGTPGVGRVGPLVGAGTTVPAKAPRALRHAKKKAPAGPPAPSCVAPGSMVFFLIEVKKKKGRRRTR